MVRPEILQAYQHQVTLMVALLTSVTKNRQTLLKFVRTLPPEGDVTTDGRVPATATPITINDEAMTTTVATSLLQRLRQHHTHLTPAQKDEVITLYQRGMPVRETCPDS